MSSKKGLNLHRNYSINFSIPKRSKNLIKFIIIHYTGMRKESKALERLCDVKSEVSSHYFIKKNGKIYNLVPDLYTAWHAGKSNWRNLKSLNKYSIGIEISNPGHDNKYKQFKKKQIYSLFSLITELKKKYHLKNKNILGHSDVAPDRKKDPGEKFPWKLLSKNKLCIWHNLSKKRCKKLRKRKLENIDSFYKLLFKFGYEFTKNSSDKTKIYKNFQRRFRPELISDVVDKECYAILKSLI